MLRASGLGGDLRIQLFRPRRQVLGSEPGDVWIDLPDGGERRFRVERARFADPYNAIVHLAGVADRTAAEALHGAFVRIDPADPPLLLCDAADRLLGAAAIDRASGSQLGRVVAVEDNGAQSLLVIESTGGREVLIPFVEALIAAVEPGRVVIESLPGLFDE